jgi:hypothetical protein
MSFITEEERDALQEVMDRQKLAEANHASYWSQIKGALRNPITMVSSIWGIIYFVAYYGACVGAGAHTLQHNTCRVC